MQRSWENTLGKLVKLPLREVWKHEAYDFSHWLSQEEQLSALAEMLDLDDLSLKQLEAPVGEFRVDILCEDSAGLVIIENQLTRSNHNHLGQLLTYAATLEAKKVIWIAEEFRDEHITALEYLNEHSRELSFYALKISLWKIDDSRPSPQFEVVVRPDEWKRDNAEMASSSTDNQRMSQLYLQYWLKFVEKAASRIPNYRFGRPHPRYWLTHRMYSGVFLNPVFNLRQKRIGVEIYIANDANKSLFRYLEAHQTEIEKQLGVELDWQELAHKKAARIAIWLDNIDISMTDHWSEYMEWMIDKFTQMEKTFRPYLESYWRAVRSGASGE